MRAIRYKYIVLILLLLLVAFGVFRWWQGPQVTGYTLEPMPLVQSVVATGQVITVSRAQVGSEVTGVVLERRVKEGDRVKPGDLLVVLKSDELAAQVRQAEVALNGLATNRRPQASAELASAKAQLEQVGREATRRRNAEAGILTEPALLLADEPTGNLDTQTASEVFELFRKINKEQGCAILLVTHDPRLSVSCDRTIKLVDGLIQSDTKTAPADIPEST